MSSFDALDAQLDQAMDQVFGDDAALYLSTQTPGVDEPALTGIRVIYDENYQSHDVEGYASYHQVISLASKLSDTVSPELGQVVVIDSTEYELLQRIAVDGTQEIWSVSK